MAQSARFDAFIEELPSPSDLWDAAKEHYVTNGGGDGKLSTLPDGREVIFWEDGAGNEAHFVTPALPGGEKGTILVRVYDHESEFNVYGIEGAPIQPAIEGIPEELVTTVGDPDLFGFRWDEEGNPNYFTGFLWNLHSVWEYTDSFRHALEEADDDGGFKYVLGPFIEN